MRLPKQAWALIRSMRLFQWTKNLAVFAAILFNGKLFTQPFLGETIMAFISFCLISSSSYLINDVVDAPLDRRHPQKRNRPIAKGDLSGKQAVLAAIFLSFLGFLLAFRLGIGFFILTLGFVLIHLVYSFFLKKMAILDITGISFSFIFRALAGETATGYHLPIWLMMAVVFLSLFVASGKRRSELVSQGSEARPALGKYKRGLLNFYMSIFAVSTLISYALFTYTVQPLSFSQTAIRNFLLENMPQLIDRKWLMITIFPVILGIMRYSQLVLERKRGQRPEIVLASDIPLLSMVLLWGMMLIVVIYVF